MWVLVIMVVASVGGNSICSTTVTTGDTVLFHSAVHIHVPVSSDPTYRDAIADCYADNSRPTTHETWGLCEAFHHRGNQVHSPSGHVDEGLYICASLDCILSGIGLGRSFEALLIFKALEDSKCIFAIQSFSYRHSHFNELVHGF